MRMVLFLGRSLEGILRDAAREFPLDEYELIVVARDGDRLDPPAEVADRVIPVSAFSAQPDDSYTVIANGGTSRQLVPVLRALVELGCPLEVYDLQRDGCQKLW